MPDPRSRQRPLTDARRAADDAQQLRHGRRPGGGPWVPRGGIPPPPPPPPLPTILKRSLLALFRRRRRQLPQPAPLSRQSPPFSPSSAGAKDLTLAPFAVGEVGEAEEVLGRAQQRVGVVRRGIRRAAGHVTRKQEGADLLRIGGRGRSGGRTGCRGRWVGLVEGDDQQPVLLVGGGGEDLRHPLREEGVGGRRTFGAPCRALPGDAGVAEVGRDEGVVGGRGDLRQAGVRAGLSGGRWSRNRRGRAASGSRRTGSSAPRIRPGPAGRPLRRRAGRSFAVGLFRRPSLRCSRAIGVPRT